MYHFINFLKSSRFWLHFAFWCCVLLLILLYTSDPEVIVANLLIQIVATYLAHHLVVDRFYKKGQFKHFLIAFLSFILIYSVLIYYLLIWIDLKDRDDFLSVLVGVFAFTFFTTSAKIARYSYFKEKEYARVQIQQLQSELSLLKAQVNPHFLFNTLNNLYGLITQHQNEKAAEITLKLSGLMRYLLESSKAEKVSLHKEVQFLEDYLALERIRLAKNTDIRFEASGLDKEVFVAPLLLVPLVENAFKHGLQSISDQNFAHFSLSLQGNELYFEAQNSIGKTLESPAQSGTGLANLRKRLALAYPEKHFLEIEAQVSIFKATLYIKL